MRKARGIFPLVFVCLAGITAALGAVGCSSASDARANQDAHGKLILSWSGGAARLCVTDKDAVCPEGKDDAVAGGKAYWVIDATCFNAGDGFDSPVTYGVVPNCAKDVSAAHGAIAGGAPLHPGDTYKVTITSFGGSPSSSEITWH